MTELEQAKEDLAATRLVVEAALRDLRESDAMVQRLVKRQKIYKTMLQEWFGAFDDADLTPRTKDILAGGNGGIEP